MEKNQYELCVSVLKRLHEKELLDHIILIGSWCMPFYKEYFSDVEYLSTIKTRDVDFLIPFPKNIRTNTDIPKLFKDLGFIVGFSTAKGYMRLEHPDLIIEFLVPEKGRGTDKPIDVAQLKINATALRYLNILSEKTIKVRVTNFDVLLPHPATFALHKLIISNRRQQKDKSTKDKIMAIEILNALIRKKNSGYIRSYFTLLPVKLQKIIADILKCEHELELLEILQKKRQ